VACVSSVSSWASQNSSRTQQDSDDDGRYAEDDDDDAAYFPPPELLDDVCLQAIVEHCSSRLNFERDASPCAHYLELFTSCRFNALSEEYQIELERGIRQGREGKGLVFVFASGNDYSLGGYTNFEGLGNSRYVITVGAVDRNGRHASYSTSGASLFVVAPGGDTDVQTGFVAAAAGTNECSNFGSGTSYATPVVSGVIALMLEANPRLTWRDVQGVLAQTSQVVSRDDPSWVTNAAGYSHSYKYGFGIVHAGRAVRTAREWVSWGNESVLSAFSGVIILALDDDSDRANNEGLSSSHSRQVQSSTVTVRGNMTLESVVVYVDVHHSSRGHLKIKLTSPQGTESILTPGQRPESLQISDKVRWKLMTLRKWGESSAGNWTLSVVDTEPGDAGGEDCVDYPFDDDAALDYDCGRVYLELGPQGLSEEDACLVPIVADKCCFCGGGADRSSYRNSLVSWTLVLYGRNLQEEPLESPMSSNDDSDSAPPDDIQAPSRGPGFESPYSNDIATTGTLQPTGSRTVSIASDTPETEAPSRPLVLVSSSDSSEVERGKGVSSVSSSTTVNAEAFGTFLKVIGLATALFLA
jgi:hypothetical protein